MKGFEFLEPGSVGEACQLLSEYGEEAKLFAGGIALVKLLKKRLIHPSCLVNIKGIRELQFVREDRDGLKIGALSTLTEIECSPLIRERFSALAEMVRTIASVQIRNVGTLVGNLCFADPASDPAPLLIALGARLKVRSSEEERTVPLEGFFTDFYETTLRQDEIVEEVHVPPLPENSGAIYVKHTMRVAFDLAIVGVAVWLGLNPKSLEYYTSRLRLKLN